MPFLMIRNDITKMKVDAIVNAAKPSLLGGGGVDGAIHRAAGSQLLEECKTLNGCQTGEAKITKGYDLDARYVIHTVGPIWKGGSHNEKDNLIACYQNSLELATQYQCESIAFPLISTGVYQYPKQEAFQIAQNVITQYLQHHDMTVYLVIYDKETMKITSQYHDILEYIDDYYVDSHFEKRRGNRLEAYAKESIDSLSEPMISMACDVIEECSLADELDHLDESFSQMLMRKIDESGMKDSECYKRANISRKLFSKIRSDDYYKPSKNTVLAFAIALQLSLAETNDMLQKAGFALSHANKADIIVEYFIKNHNYDIFAINDALFTFDQQLIGM